MRKLKFKEVFVLFCFLTKASGYVNFPCGSDGRASAYNAGDSGSVPGWEDPLEKEMAPHSSTLAWKIPWTEEPGSYSPWGHQESDTAERLQFHFH